MFTITKNMKINYLILFILFLCQLGNANNYGKIMCVGDSLTAGGTYNVSYRKDLYYALVNHQDTFNFVGPINYGNFPGDTNNQNVHAGFGGWTAANLLNGNPYNIPAGKIDDWLATYNPDTVILMAGTNDYYELDSLTFTYTWDATVDQVFRSLMIPRYNQLLTKIYNNNPNMRVVIMCPPKVLNGFANGLFYAYTQHLVSLIQEIENQWAVDHKIQFADLWTFVSDNIGVDIGPDGIHWITAGGAKAGGLAFDACNKLFTPVQMNLTLKDYDGSYPSTISANIVDSRGYTMNKTFTFDGQKYVTSIDLFPSTDTFVHVKYDHWLSSSGMIINGNVDMTLTNGDVDKDNFVSVFDYGILSDFFDRASTDSDWTLISPNGFAPKDADLDGDGRVSVFDYGILSGNFDEAGS